MRDVRGPLKAARVLCRKDDECVKEYDKSSLMNLLTNRWCHSPEISETDDDYQETTTIHVYNYS